MFTIRIVLATWGMFRNSDLQTKSFKVYECLIKEVSKEEHLWNIDVMNYPDDGIEKILKFKTKISNLLRQEGISPTDTLTSKIIMGVFGCVPAYDNYFKKTLKTKSFGKNSLNEIHKFYCDHQEYLDDKQKRLQTLDVNGGLTLHTYKKAKIIDLIAFRVEERIELLPILQPDVNEALENDRITMSIAKMINKMDQTLQESFLKHIFQKNIGKDELEVYKEKGFWQSFKNSVTFKWPNGSIAVTRCKVDGNKI